MESTTTDKSGSQLSGMDSIRAKAKRQTMSKLKRYDMETDEEFPIASTPTQDIRTLKERERHAIEKEEEIRAEPIWIEKVWHRFQEAIGNR